MAMMMITSASSCIAISCPALVLPSKLTNPNESRLPSTSPVQCRLCSHSPLPQSPSPVLPMSVPLAATVAIMLWSNPAQAGFLSGSTGIESIPGPQLPSIDFLSRFNEQNQKKYAENDERFKSSPALKQLLERSKLNKDKNRQAVLDKYCLRGAEWGVGDCSTAGMTVEERDNFIAMLKQKAGVTD